MPEPLVSVHMITYNHKPYIARAIDSVLSQITSFPFELVIGEDCSTDGTREIVFEYQAKHPDIIHVVTSEKNVGMKKNAYRTSMACRGKYVAYCEGDDFWQRHDKLQIQADYLEGHPECGLVHSDQDRYCAETGQTIKKFFRTTNNVPPEPLNVFKGWGGIYNILTCTVMARRRMIESIMNDSPLYLDENNLGGTDVPLFIEISMLSQIHYMDESLATYTVQRESASNTQNLQKKAKFIKSNIESYLYLAEKYNQSEDKLQLEIRWYRVCLWVAFWEKNTNLAQEVKRNDKRFSIKAWALYAGAVNRVVHFIMCSILNASHKWKRRSMLDIKKYSSD